MKVKFTRTSIAKLERPDVGSVTHWDEALPGFGLRITASGVRTYVVKFRVGKQQRWVSIGRAEHLGLDAARSQARAIFGRIAVGEQAVPERADPEPEPSASVTFREFAERWLREHAEPRFTHASFIRTRSRLERLIYPRIGGMPLVDIRRRDIHQMHAQMAECPSRANLCVSLVRSIFNSALRFGELPETHANPARMIQRFPESRREVALSREQRIRLFEVLRRERAAPDKYVASVACCLWLIAVTGMRRGEAQDLRWDSVDLENGVIRLASHKTVRKVGTRLVPINSRARVILLEATMKFGNPDYVFPGTRRGHPIGDGVLNTQLHRIAEVAKLGIEITPHGLRHTFASVAAQAGFPEAVIGGLIGHKGTTMTSRYVHLDVAALRGPADRVAAAVEAQELPEGVMLMVGLRP